MARAVLDARHFGIAQCARESTQRDAIEWLLACNGWLLSDMAEPQRTERDAIDTSDARVVAMELGLNPWPSASGWAPMDLPWKERRILIGIVDGIATLCWLQKCSGCGRYDCGSHLNEDVCPRCNEHDCYEGGCSDY